MNDIYAYFDYYGTLKERVSAPIRANATQVNAIFAYWENSDVSPVSYSITWHLVGSTSNETTSDYTVEEQAIPSNYLGERDLRFFREGQAYPFVRFAVPSEVTAVPGTYTATIRYALSAQATFVLGSLTFLVEGDDGIVLGDSLTLDQYNYLLAKYLEIDDRLPLSGGSLTGSLEAPEYLLNDPGPNIPVIQFNNDGSGDEIRFGGTTSPKAVFLGDLAVTYEAGGTVPAPKIREEEYDGDTVTVAEKTIATREWSDGQYLKRGGDSTYGNFAFTAGTNFTVSAGASSYTSHPITLNSGSNLTLKSGATLKAEGNSQFNGAVTLNGALSMACVGYPNNQASILIRFSADEGYEPQRDGIAINLYTGAITPFSPDDIINGYQLIIEVND